MSGKLISTYCGKYCHEQTTDQTLQVWPRQIFHWMGQSQGSSFILYIFRYFKCHSTRANLLSAVTGSSQIYCLKWPETPTFRELSHTVSNNTGVYGWPLYARLSCSHCGVYCCLKYPKASETSLLGSVMEHRRCMSCGSQLELVICVCRTGLRSRCDILLQLRKNLVNT